MFDDPSPCWDGNLLGSCTEHSVLCVTDAYLVNSPVCINFEHYDFCPFKDKIESICMHVCVHLWVCAYVHVCVKYKIKSKLGDTKYLLRFQKK